jgi:hypothetical protein
LSSSSNYNNNNNDDSSSNDDDSDAAAADDDDDDDEGKPVFIALYGMYTVKLNELKAIVKVNLHTGQSGVADKTSFESMGRGCQLPGNKETQEAYL